MEYIRGLGFNQEPDYERVKSLLRRGARLKSVVIPKGNKPDLISEGQKAMKSQNHDMKDYKNLGNAKPQYSKS